jgi:hypothetical protein
MTDTTYRYITAEEVQRVCRDIGISDWTKLTSQEIDPVEAEIVRGIVGGESTNIAPEDFRLGLEIELEHGLRFSDANVTCNHPVLTGRIVLAHLKEGLDYYARLHCMELEMELSAAILSGDAVRTEEKYRDLAAARMLLEERKASARAPMREPA